MRPAPRRGWRGGPSPAGARRARPGRRRGGAAASPARRRDAASAGSAAATGSLPGCRPAPRGSRRHRARTRPGRGGPPCGRSPTRPGGRGRRTRRRGRGRPSRRSPDRRPDRPLPHVGGRAHDHPPRAAAGPRRAACPRRACRGRERPRAAGTGRDAPFGDRGRVPSVPGRDVDLVGLDPALRPRRRAGGPAPEPPGHGSNVGPAQAQPPGDLPVGEVQAREAGARRPDPRRPAVAGQGGAGQVVERAAHASRRWRWRCRRASPRPWRTTAALPHPGRRTPSGRRCRRTGAWRLASSIRDEGFAGLAGDTGRGRSAVGLPTSDRLPPRSSRPHAQHPGSRDEPLSFAAHPCHHFVRPV